MQSIYTCFPPKSRKTNIKMFVNYKREIKFNIAAAAIFNFQGK